MSSTETMAMLKEKGPLLLLMDGHAMVHRAWHAIRQPLNVRSTGEEVRAVYGFLNSFLKFLSEWQPTHCAIAFDLPTPTFRHLQFKEYKAHRPPSPPELRGQFKRVRQLMEAFTIPIFEMAGYEADDVLGTLAWQAERRKISTLILTGDTDTLQLVSPWVRVLLSHGSQNRTVYDQAKVKERYSGLGPEVLPDLKALQGDPSDNIPGVPSVGAKTAARLMSTFGSIEDLYENLDKVTPSKLQKVLRDNQDLALKAKSLTMICREVPLTLDLEDSRFWRYDRDKVVDLVRELEFYSQASKIPASRQNKNEEADPIITKELPNVHYVTVDTEEALDKMEKELASAGSFSFDTETTSKKAMKAELVGLSFSTAPGRSWYVPVGHLEGKQLPLAKVLERIGPLFERGDIAKSAHNANFDTTVLGNYGIQSRNLKFDTMIAAHLSGRKAIGLKALALECFNHEMTPITALIGSGKTQISMAQTPIERASEYAAADADFTQRLKTVFENELEQKDLTGLFDRVEIPLVSALVRIQRNGVAIDAGLLKQMSAELGNGLSNVESEMYALVGHTFNLNSSQQLGDVLFKELRLPPTRRTQKGHSTDAASLDTLKNMLDQGRGGEADPKAYQVLSKILEYRHLAKIKSTYVDALPGLIDPNTGRIHTSYNQTGAATGRVSSTDPNVQNIPVRTELGRRVRKAFIAQQSPEWTLLGADYSQIELRILAHLSEDQVLLSAFHNGEDIHASTAASVYGIHTTDITPDMRRIAKIMNFGILYGLSPYGIRQQTGLAPDEGAKFIEAYFSKYPGIRTYIDKVKTQVHETEYVETLLGRRRYIPEIRSSNHNVRAAAERMAINMPIQGTAADIIKIAIIRIQERMDSLNLRSMMIIQVHDELIFEVPQQELEEMKALVLELMPSAMKLTVPLEVELKTGYTWGDME